MPFLPGECDPRPPDEAFLDDAEIAAWFSSRGAKLPKLPAGATTGACFRLPEGNGGEEAMVCSSTRIETQGSPTSGTSTYRRVDRVRVFVVTGRRVVTLLEAPLLFDMMDKDMLEEGALFALRVVRDEHGKPVVREPSEGGCDRARSHLAESLAIAGTDPMQQRWAAFDRGLVDRLCRAAGKGPPAPTSGGSSL